MNSERGILATAMVAEIEKGGIPIAYLRNHEQLPIEVGNDVDLLVPYGNRNSAAKIMISRALAQGWHLLARIEFSPLSLVFGNPETGELLQVDLFDRIEWHAVEFADSNAIINRRRWNGFVYIPDESDEIYLNLVTRLIYEGRIREKHREQARRHSGASEDILAAFRRHLGKRGEVVAERLRRSDWNESAGSRNAIIGAALIRFGIRSPLRLARGPDATISDNTVLARTVTRNGYDSITRSVGIGIGNTSSDAWIKQNTTFGFDIGVGPVDKYQSIPHYVIDHRSIEDELPIDPRGVISE